MFIPKKVYIEKEALDYKLGKELQRQFLEHGVPVEILEENSEEGTVKLNVEVDKVDADMAAIIYVGPMERDVEFKVIPKMETLTLVQAIEDEVEEIVPEDESEEVEIEEENLAVVADNEKSSNNVILIIAGVAVVVAIGAVVIVKAKKK